MRSRLLSFALPVVAFFAPFTPVSHAAQVQNRIVSAVNGSDRVPVEHTVPTRALRSTDLGPAPANRELNELSLRFNMTAAQQADLTQLLAGQLNPSSPNYHQWLTPEQFGARFGLSSSDVAKVSSWLTSQGFHVTGVARSSTFITFTGTVAQAQQAFGTSIHNLTYNGEQHISNVTDPVLPAAIAGVVTHITGLNDFKLKPRSRASTVKLNPNYTYTSAGTTSHYIAPGDFYTIYDVSPLLTSSINGTGMTIAVMGQSDLPPNAVTAFRSAAGLTTNPPTVQLYGADPGVVQGDVDEASLDVEWSGAVAPSAKILFVTSGDVINTSLTQAIDNNLAPIMSISYGECEPFYTNSQLNTYNQLFQQANAEGITLIAAAGDDGATDCDSAGLASEGLSVDFPGSSPFFTSSGGSMFNGDLTNPSGSWNTTNGTNGGSATGYIAETVWNETNASGGLTTGGAGGGGASAFFSKPAWQVCTTTACGTIPADSARDVPDFSLNSGAIHDGTIVCSVGDCTNGFLDSSGNIDIFGGTSVAAPTFSGLLALVEQKLGGGRLGNIGPNLYGLANSTYYANVFHDIVSGTNAVPCIQGTPNCTTGNPIGYSASAGYDLASGFGSIDAANLVQYWALAPPTGGGSVIGTALSNTTLTTSTALCGISGNLALNVMVSSVGSSSTMPTGTVQFFVDNVALAGASVPLVSGAATYTLITSSLSSGQHNVSVVYSGDANFAGSKGSLISSAGIIAPIDVVSSSSADFSITPCTASTNVVTGSAAQAVVLTIAPFNGFQGSVNLSASSDTGDLLGYAFSVKPVVINSTSSATTSFVLTATVTTTNTLANAIKHPSEQHPSGRQPMGRAPWYAAGSGATLACLVLFAVPRRRRWGALLAVVLSVAAIGAVGCGQSTSNSGGAGGGGGGGGGGGTTTTPATPGTYNITITATSGTLVHSVVLTYNIQQ